MPRILRRRNNKLKSGNGLPIEPSAPRLAQHSFSHRSEAFSSVSNLLTLSPRIREFPILARTLSEDYASLSAMYRQTGMNKEADIFDNVANDFRMLEYPPKAIHDVDNLLRKPYPVWLLDPKGVVRAANLLAFWVWNAQQPQELLQHSAFDIFSRNIENERIPVPQNQEFLSKKSSVVKRVNANWHSPLYASFISTMNRRAELKAIFDLAGRLSDEEWESVREWQYPLRIRSAMRPPRGAKLLDLLQFQVTVFRLEGDAGFLATYMPMGITNGVVEHEYDQLLSTYGKDAFRFVYVQSKFPDYYPVLEHSLSFYIIRDNEAQRHLLNTSAEGMHFIELCFSPQAKMMLGEGQRSQTQNVVRAWYYLARGNAELRQQFEIEKKQLALKLGPEWALVDRILQEWKATLESGRSVVPKNHILRFLEHVEFPMPVSDIYPMYFLNDDTYTTLHCKDLIQRLSEDQDHPPSKVRDREFYRISLVPGNQESKAALILIDLLAHASPDHIGSTRLTQLHWGRSLVATIQEGVIAGRTYIDWEPQAAFERIWEEQGELSKERNVSGTVEAEIHEVSQKLTNLLPPINRTAQAAYQFKEQYNDEGDGLLDIIMTRVYNKVQYPLPTHTPIETPENNTKPMPTSSSTDREKGTHRAHDLQTMVFHDEDKYMQFLEYVFDRLGGQGLELTDAPISTSVRVRSWVLPELPQEIIDAMHPINDEDVSKALEGALDSGQFLDVEDFEQFSSRPTNESE